MSCRNGSLAAASFMRCSRRGGAYSHPSALCSTFLLGSAPSGASWSAARHHDDQRTHASPLSGCKFDKSQVEQIWYAVSPIAVCLRSSQQISEVPVRDVPGLREAP